MPKNPSRPTADTAPQPVATTHAGKFRFECRHWVMAVILVFALYLRISSMDVMLWAGNDPATATMLAARMALGMELPQKGLMFSVGVWQTPLEIYLIAPFMVFSQDPTWFPKCWAVLCTGAVFLCFLIGRKFFSERVGLIAAALFAVAPWPIMFSRQAWAQGIVHGLAVPLLWFWCKFLTEKKPAHFFWVILLTLFMAQIHLAAFALIALIVLMWLVLRFKIAWKPFWLAVLVNFITVVPYISYQMDRNWEDFKRSASVMKSFQEYQHYTIEGIHPEFGFPLPSKNHFDQMLNLLSGRQFEELNGLSTPKFNALPGMGLLNGASALEKGLLLLSLFVLGGHLVRRAKPSPRFPFFDLAHEPLLTLLFLWVITGWAFFEFTGMKSYVLYFSFIFPVPFILIGWLLTRFRAKWLTTLGLAMVVAITLGQGIFIERLYRFWRAEGGAQGTRGEAYIHQLNVAEAIIERAPSKSPIVSTDWPPRTPSHLGIQYILWWKLRNSGLSEALPPGQTQPAFVVVDTRFKTQVPAGLEALSYRNFGPLRLYELTWPPR